MSALRPCPRPDCAATPDIADHHFHYTDNGAHGGCDGTACSPMPGITECYSAHIPAHAPVLVLAGDFRDGDIVDVTYRVRVADYRAGWACDDAIGTCYNLLRPNVVAIRLVSRPDPDAALAAVIAGATSMDWDDARALVDNLRIAGYTITGGTP